MNSTALNIEQRRYERKFVPEISTAAHVKNIVLSLPAFFRPLYHPRYVNNIYFDTVNFDNFYDNVHGRSERKKVRIRWYGDLLGENVKPILEIKIKSAFVGDKKQYPLPECNISDILNSGKKRKALFNDAGLPVDIINLLKKEQPYLLNRYLRNYFIDHTGNFRMTVDQDVRYQPVRKNFNPQANPQLLNNFPVLELKYDEQFDDMARDVTDYIPFRIIKNSKYVNGMEAFYSVRA
ncbi:MAG: polyphosphate polymerase domain-containing protein [Bacteroidales bacterium]